MKNIIMDRKTIALILLTVFLVCGVQSISHGFFGGIIDVIGDIGGAVGDAVGAVGQAVGIVVNVIADTVKVTAEAVGLTIRVIAVIVWHTDSLWDIEPFPNGGIIGVVISNLIHLWDPLTGDTTATLTHDANINSIAFSPDGLLLASASEDGTVQLWNPQTKQSKPPLIGHTDSVSSVAFSFDGLLLASGSADNTIRLWDPNTGTLQATLRGHTDSVLSIAFSPDGLLLASGSADGTVRLWNPQIHTLEATFREHTDSVLSVAFSPDGSLLASASIDNTVRLWNPQTEQQIVSLDHQSPVLSIAFNPNGDLLASGSTDGTARLWNLHPDPQAAKVVATLGHESPVRSVTFSPHGNTLFSGSADGKTRQWEITIETETGKIEVVDTSTEDASRRAFESSTPSGYTRVTLNDSGTVWGGPTKFTTDSSIGKVTYILLAKLKGCDFASAELSGWSKVYIKTESLGHLNNYQSESVCGTSSHPWSSSWNGRRITHLRFFDESSSNSINEAIYNIETEQYELTTESDTPRASEGDTSDETPLTVDVSPESSQIQDIVSISEVMYGSERSFTPVQWIELHNAGSDIISLAGWKLVIQNVKSPELTGPVTATITFKDDFWGDAPRLWPNDVVLVVGSSDSNSKNLNKDQIYELDWRTSLSIGFWTTWLSAKGFSIKLLDNAGNLVDEAGNLDDDVIQWKLPYGENRGRTRKGQRTSLIRCYANSIALDGTQASGWFTAVDANLTSDQRKYYGDKDDISTPGIGIVINDTSPELTNYDVNLDGSVDVSDLVFVAGRLGQSGPNTADVNGDGFVNVQDLILVAGDLGQAPAAPSLHSAALTTFTAAAVQGWLTEAQGLNLTDVKLKSGIRFLEQLLLALIPKETALLPNYPNPFNPETWIPYRLAKSADVTLTIYAIDGQTIRQLALGYQPAGIYQNRSRAAYWDGRNAVGEPVASGVYFYTLTAGDFTATRKMLIRK